MTEKKPKVLAIGLDGGTFALLEPLARRGIMPGLAALMERGTWGPLRSTVPPVTAPAWTSFITGKNPGGHGIYQFFSLNPLSADSLGMGQKSYLAIPGIVVNSSRIPGNKLWSLVDRAGLTQVTLNLPMAYPPEPVNGVMVTGMLTPPGSRRTTWPPELAREMDDYEIDLNPREKDFSGPSDLFLRRVGEILEKRIRWSLKLMRERPWDFFMVVITETDRLQHRFFDLVDPQGCLEADPARLELIPRLQELYREVDRGISRLVEAAGKDARLVILSDHGFGRAPVDLVDLRVLTTLLCLEEDPEPPSGGAGPGAGGWRRALGRFRPTKSRIYRWLPFLPEGWLRRAESAYRRRRLRGQKAILFKMHENVGGVWINLRDEQGRILEQGAHAALLADLRERLALVTWKGERIVERVAAREELYRGPYLDSAPDLVFVLNEAYGILEPDLAPPTRELVVRVTAERPRKKGTHRMEGMFLVAGPDIRRGAVVREAAIEDMTATVLHLLGCPVPEDMDGRVLVEALEPAYLAAFPVRREAAGRDAPAGRESAYDADEEKAIKERLEGIGYLD